VFSCIPGPTPETDPGDSAGVDVGKHEASAKTEGGAGGFERVSARRHVVHEIGLAECQRLAAGGEMMLIG